MEDIFLTIEPLWEEIDGKLTARFWLCDSAMPNSQAIGETRMEALKNWEDAYKDYKHPHPITVDDLLEDVRV